MFAFSQGWWWGSDDLILAASEAVSLEQGVEVWRVVCDLKLSVRG